MARNDVFLNINALSPADAVVTGQQDMTAATVPELVLGDTPTFNFYFTDNTNVWPSWAGNASYTLTWALSDAVAGDFAPAATTGNATPITGGWSVILPLNSYDLVGLLNTKRVGQPYPVQNLWQQLRVTDPSGNEVTRAMFWTPVRYRTISDTQNTESASPTGGRFVTVNNVNTLTTPTAAQFYTANPVPTSALGTAANGELLIGNGTGFTKSTLTAGTGITVTNGSGSITIDATGAQEILTATVKNAESVAITKGQVVYLFSATGGFPSVKLANNTSDATSNKTFGVVSDTSIAPNGTGTVTCVGVVDGLNLAAYNDGDAVYLGASAGTFTATKPYAPNHLVFVGIIERANMGNGELYVRIQNGYELEELHNVQITTPPLAGSLLMYDATNSLWKANRLTGGTNIAVTNADTSVTLGLTGTVAVANGGTGVTTSTGSGSVVLSTSPTLTTPILGTPQSGTLSSCTGLPISSGVSGLGTNVATALGTNVGSAGAFVVNGGALGTPSSGTLSSCSGLPISTGVSGLGTNVATFLATPSSANLAAAVTDETGTGALVFANTPTLVTPNIGAATGTSVNLSGAGTFGGNLTVSGTGNSAIGTYAPVVNTALVLGGTPTLSNALGFKTGLTIGHNLTAAVSDDLYGQLFNYTPTGTSVAFTVAGSGTHPSAHGAVFGPPTIFGTSATVTNASSVYISGAPTGGTVTNRYTLLTGSGAVQFGGDLTVSGTGTHSFAGQVTSTVNAANTSNLGSFVASNATLNSFTSYSPSASLDQKYWTWQSGTAIGDGTIRLRALNDAQNNGINAITVTRSGISSTAVNVGGNLTVSGTTGVTVSAANAAFLQSNSQSGFGSASALITGGSAVNTAISYFTSAALVFGKTNSSEVARFAATSGNFLLGTTTDGGQKLQVNGDATFAGDRVINRKDQNGPTRLQARNDTSGTAAGSQVAATLGDFTTYTAMGSLSAGFTTSGLFVANTGYIASNATAGLNLFTVGATSLTLGTNNTTALTLDSSQNATFAGTNVVLSGTGTREIKAVSTNNGQTSFVLDGGSGNAWSIYKPASSTDIRFYGNGADRLTLTNAGNATFAGTIATQGGTASTPASASATGTAGTIQWDASYIYVCTAANTWKRVAIATW